MGMMSWVLWFLPGSGLEAEKTRETEVGEAGKESMSEWGECLGEARGLLRCAGMSARLDDRCGDAHRAFKRCVSKEPRAAVEEGRVPWVLEQYKSAGLSRELTRRCGSTLDALLRLCVWDPLGEQGAACARIRRKLYRCAAKEHDHSD